MGKIIPATSMADVMSNEQIINPPMFFFIYMGDWRPIPVTYWQMIVKPFYFRARPFMLNTGVPLNPSYFKGKTIKFVNTNGEIRILKIQEIEELQDYRFFCTFEDVT